MADVSDKWGGRVAERGFAQIPNYLLQLNQFLEDDRLAPVELLVVLQLAGAWWRKDELPFPSVATLAARCGTSTRQIQRAVNRLEELKLIARVKRRTRGIISSNAYDLEPLVAFLDDLAKVYPNAYPRRIRTNAAPPPDLRVEGAGGTKNLRRPRIVRTGDQLPVAAVKPKSEIEI